MLGSSSLSICLWILWMNSNLGHSSGSWCWVVLYLLSESVKFFPFFNHQNGWPSTVLQETVAFRPITAYFTSISVRKGRREKQLKSKGISLLDFFWKWLCVMKPELNISDRLQRKAKRKKQNVRTESLFTHKNCTITRTHRQTMTANDYATHIDAHGAMCVCECSMAHSYQLKHTLTKKI